MGMLDWFRAPKRQAKRRFEAAQYNRMTHSFMQSARSINVELRGDLDALRRRSRELSKNEPLAKKYLAMVVQNVCGANGFVLQCRVQMDSGKTDKLANDAIELAWLEWSAPAQCDVSGKLSFADMTRAIVRAVARDGEAIVRVHNGYANKFGYALQLLDIERLDTTLNRDEGNGKNAIVMGVEVDGNGKPVAYHMVTHFLGRDITARKTTRIPADEIIHLFMTDDPEQIRGIPWMHASMIRMHHLKGYEEAAIIAARVGAAKMGFFTTPDGDGTPLSDDESNGTLFAEAEPGQFGVLPEGYGFQSFDPDYPHQMYPEFVKAAKRDIGSGLNASYHSLANDLEGVNFSSIRSGTLEERDHWMVVQSWLIGQFHNRVYESWLSSALLKFAIKMPNGSPLPAGKIQKFRAHEFMGRRWQWVDPLKDQASNVLAMENGLASPYVIAAQQGMDVEDVLADIARFRSLAESLKIPLGKPDKNPSKSEEEKDDE